VDLARDHPDRILARCGIWCRAAGPAGTRTPPRPPHGARAAPAPRVGSPALAVARALRDAQPELELAYVGGVRGLERRIVTAQAELALQYHELSVRSLRSGGVNAQLITDPIRLAASVPQAWALLGRLRPRAVFTSGGYLGIPLVMAARG